MISLYDRVAQDVAYGIITPNEARGLCGLEPIWSEDTRGIKRNHEITNCVNCGAVIDHSVDHCEYCGTSYSLMGVKNPNKKSECLRLENKLLASKVNMARELENIMQRYNDAIKAMGSYVQNY